MLLPGGSGHSCPIGGVCSPVRHSPHRSLGPPREAAAPPWPGRALRLSLWWRAESETFLVLMSLPKAAKRKREGEGRVFREKWERDYFFVEVKSLPTCLICKKIVSVLKEYNLKRHYESKHSKSYDQYTAQTREAVLNELKKGLECQ